MLVSENCFEIYTGNHEYYTMDVENWMKKLDDLGITVLHNTNIKVPKDNDNDKSFCIVGTDDLEADRIRYNPIQDHVCFS